MIVLDTNNAMELINALLELFGLVFPAALTFAIQRALPIAPLGPSLVPVALSGEQQVVVLCALPSLVYLTARLYFALIFGLCAKLFAPLHKDSGDTDKTRWRAAMLNVGE